MERIRDSFLEDSEQTREVEDDGWELPGMCLGSQQ